jgi:hypothetical protein
MREKIRIIFLLNVYLTCLTHLNDVAFPDFLDKYIVPSFPIFLVPLQLGALAEYGGDFLDTYLDVCNRAHERLRLLNLRVRFLYWEGMVYILDFIKKT